MNIGSYLKTLRLERGYKLHDVAEKLGLTTSYISQLENMKLSPSLDSLEKILCFYSVNLSDFFRQVEQKRFIVVKNEQTQFHDLLDGAIRLTLLASKLQNNSLETYLLEFKSRSDINTAVLPNEINGERLIYILKGNITAVIDNEPPVLLNLAAGDSLNYKSYIGCRICKDDDKYAEILITGTPPLIMHTKE